MADHFPEQTQDAGFLQSIVDGVPLPPGTELSSAWRCTRCGSVDQLSGSGWWLFRPQIETWLKKEGLWGTRGQCPAADR